MLVAMVFQTLYVLIDLYWVGRLGTDAVAAVAVSGNLMFVVLAATQMLGVGTTTLVSHAVGRKDHDTARSSSISRSCSSATLGAAVLRDRAGAPNALRGRASAPTRRPRRSRAITCAGSFRRWRCSSLSWRWAPRCAAPATSSRAWSSRARRSSSTSSSRPVLIFGWVHRRPLGRRGAPRSRRSLRWSSATSG